MKKYTLILLVFLFVFGLFSLSVNSARADDSGCTSAGPFSTTTGKPCSTGSVLECKDGDLFSALTGKPCSPSQNNSPSLFTRELSVGFKGDDVKALQQILKDAGFLSGKVDGSFGPITRGAVIKYQANNNLNTTGKLDTDTFIKIRAIRPYPNNSSITIISPNGGETWVRGTVQTISWQDTTPVRMCVNCGNSYDISLSPYYPPCMTNVCPMYMIPAPYTIAKGVSGSSYNWSVGTILDNNIASDGSYTIQVCQSGTNICGSSNNYFKIVSKLADINNFSISPDSATVKVGATATFQALFNRCPAGAMCLIGPLPVQATWTSSNSNVATVASSNLTTVVIGVAEGTATITATYTDSGGNVFKAAALVTVTGTAPAPTSAPTISSLYPISGVVGSQVTIFGSGFTSTGNKIKFGDLGSENNPVYNLNSPDGKTLIFNVPSSNYFPCWDSFPRCEVAAFITPPGVYAVSVINANGTSNAATFTVTSSTTPPGSFATVTVLSPNGGEYWKSGTVQTISWTDTTPVQSCVNCGKLYDVTLNPYYPPCTSRVCPMYPYRGPYTIANSVRGTSYSWTVGQIVSGSASVDSGTALAGQYTIQVCQTGTSVCGSSNSAFNIQ